MRLRQGIHQKELFHNSFSLLHRYIYAPPLNPHSTFVAAKPCKAADVKEIIDSVFQAFDHLLSSSGILHGANDLKLILKPQLAKRSADHQHRQTLHFLHHTLLHTLVNAHQCAYTKLLLSHCIPNKRLR